MIKIEDDIMVFKRLALFGGRFALGWLVFPDGLKPATRMVAWFRCKFGAKRCFGVYCIAIQHSIQHSQEESTCWRKVVSSATGMSVPRLLKSYIQYLTLKPLLFYVIRCSDDNKGNVWVWTLWPCFWRFVMDPTTLFSGYYSGMCQSPMIKTGVPED